jgi:hypothetical protein
MSRLSLIRAAFVTALAVAALLAFGACTASPTGVRSSPPPGPPGDPNGDCASLVHQFDFTGCAVQAP